jgi:uncharacterized protein GlcG (DUF336 family)
MPDLLQENIAARGFNGVICSMDGVLVYLSGAGGKPLIDPLTTDYQCFAAVGVSGDTRGSQDVVIDDLTLVGIQTPPRLILKAR